MSWSQRKQTVVPVTRRPDPPPSWQPRSRAEYAAYRLTLLAKILDDGMTPAQVATHLEASGNRFPEVTLEECRRYRAMADTWKPWSPVPGR